MLFSRYEKLLIMLFSIRTGIEIKNCVFTNPDLLVILDRLVLII